MKNEKNTEIEIEIDNLGINGEGVGRWNGKAVFVKNALVGERIKAKIIFSKPSFCVAIPLKRYNDAEERISPPCPLFNKCGGCSIQHIDYEAQCKYKQQLVSDCITRIGGIDAKVNKTVKSEKIYGYRNKMSLPVRQINGKTLIGLFAQSSHRIVECDNCLLQPAWNEKIIALTKEFMAKERLEGYDEEQKSGDVRHIVVREVENCLYITVVATKKIDLSAFDVLLKSHFESYALYLNVNTKDNNVILGEIWQRVSQNSTPTTVGGLVAQIHPAGFFQVNDFIRKKLYEKAVEEIRKSECDIVVDAFSGAGIMSAYFAEFAKKVYAIEINEQAHGSAVELVRNNKISNLYPILGDVKDKIGAVLDENADSRVAVVLDPPRAGCNKSILEKLCECNVSTIVYVSCNPATLARDLSILKDKYEIKSVTPYDMFPQTSNVETLVCLSRK